MKSLANEQNHGQGWQHHCERSLSVSFRKIAFFFSLLWLGCRNKNLRKFAVTKLIIFSFLLLFPLTVLFHHSKQLQHLKRRKRHPSSKCNSNLLSLGPSIRSKSCLNYLHGRNGELFILKRNLKTYCIYFNKRQITVVD